MKVSRLLKRYQATKNVEPLAHGGGKPLLINSQQIEIIGQLVVADNDASLQQLCTRLEEKTGVKVNVPTMCRLLQRLELTRKKRPAMRVKRQLNEFKSSEGNTGRPLVKSLDGALVFIDETGVNLAIDPSRERERKRENELLVNVLIIGAAMLP